MTTGRIEYAPDYRSSRASGKPVNAARVYTERELKARIAAWEAAVQPNYCSDSSPRAIIEMRDRGIIAGERERCAQIADLIAKKELERAFDERTNNTRAATAQHIASVIREGE